MLCADSVEEVERRRRLRPRHPRLHREPRAARLSVPDRRRPRRAGQGGLRCALQRLPRHLRRGSVLPEPDRAAGRRRDRPRLRPRRHGRERGPFLRVGQALVLRRVGGARAGERATSPRRSTGYGRPRRICTTGPSRTCARFSTARFARSSGSTGRSARVRCRRPRLALPAPGAGQVRGDGAATQRRASTTRPFPATGTADTSSATRLTDAERTAVIEYLKTL